MKTLKKSLTKSDKNSHQKKPKITTQNQILRPLNLPTEFEIQIRENGEVIFCDLPIEFENCASELDKSKI